MFTRSKRLSRDAFGLVQVSGRRLSSPNFSLIYSAKGRGCAVVVSKKVARLSVTRHKIKRRVLAALRTLPLPASLIVFPKKSVADLPFKDVQAELSTLLSKISK